MPRVLAQTLLHKTTLRRLDALARARGCSRSAYLCRLVEVHVRAMRPRLLRALDLLPTEEKKP
jgi:hypothetical protein